jgi:hypothetical protein
MAPLEIVQYLRKHPSPLQVAKQEIYLVTLCMWVAGHQLDVVRYLVQE